MYACSRLFCRSFITGSSTIAPKKLSFPFKVQSHQIPHTDGKPKNPTVVDLSCWIQWYEKWAHKSHLHVGRHPPFHCTNSGYDLSISQNEIPVFQNENIPATQFILTSRNPHQIWSSWGPLILRRKFQAELILPLKILYSNVLAE